MSNEKLGNRHCYICKAYIPPLVSICWSCGYSQLPAPDAQGGAGKASGKGDVDKTRAPGKPGGDLAAGRPSSGPDFKAGFRKK